ncbi:MAG: hypothetical protein EPO25_07770 [Gammaproteobacteria bacterium]|nr:MAG: hypothetical protein EPO25_07770 [Gammaproteobacteria bacterium]
MTRPAPSLRARVLVTLALLLLGAAVIAAWALDALYRDLGQRSRREVLEAQVIALIAAADLDATGRLVPGDVTDARLATPGSGLYAGITGATSLWRSPSLVGSGLELTARPAPGERRLEQLRLADGGRVLALSFGTRWTDAEGVARDYVIHAAESLEPWYAEMARMRARLTAGALALAVLLLAGLGLALRVALRPLGRLEAEIADVELGRRELLGEGWPRELAGITGNLNALLAGERQRLERYRTTLGNLAHSLKTPLAALRSLVEAAPPEQQRALAPHLERMSGIIQHQLKRAVFGGSGATLADLTIGEPLEQLRQALAKVYADRRPRITLQVSPGVAYPIDAGDFMELAGSLLDNACKYGRGEVRVRAGPWRREGWRRPGLEFEVEDNGPGIAEAERGRVLERGVRADESVDGQGIGLAVAREIAGAYGGALDLGTSPLGGARALLRLPGR